MKLAFEGRTYIRPIGRGIILEEGHNGEGEKLTDVYLEDVLEDALGERLYISGGRCKIRIEVEPND